jgi:ubiquinone/menaquinone biosynthesis C-methylase UbiE
MQKRKIKEIEYYNEKAAKILNSENHRGDFENFNPLLLSSYKFLYYLIQKNCKNKKVLDYGCGNGVHSFFIADQEAKVIAIDLSENILEAAEKRITDDNTNKVEFTKMDCENLDLESNSFDIVFDGGTFSSLDLGKAYSEISRVLKNGGKLIGIETFGHNPFANFKRIINKITGKRTEWAADHILKRKDLKKAEKYFDEIKVYYFHLFSCLMIPFLDNPIGKFLFSVLEKIDNLLLKIPFLKKYAFKIVFVFSKK